MASSSARNGCRLHQIPRSAISAAVASSVSCPCSMHLTPARIAICMPRGVYTCTVTYVPQFSAASTAARISASVYSVTSSGS